MHTTENNKLTSIQFNSTTVEVTKKYCNKKYWLQNKLYYTVEADYCDHFGPE